MLFSTEKYNVFQSRNPGIWALQIPGFGIEKTSGILGLRDLGSRDYNPYSELVRYRPTRNGAKAGFFAFPQVKNHQLLCARQYWYQ